MGEKLYKKHLEAEEIYFNNNLKHDKASIEN